MDRKDSDQGQTEQRQIFRTHTSANLVNYRVGTFNHIYAKLT
jgi:hypothetical protein